MRPSADGDQPDDAGDDDGGSHVGEAVDVQRRGDSDHDRGGVAGGVVPHAAQHDDEEGDADQNLHVAGHRCGGDSCNGVHNFPFRVD